MSPEAVRILDRLGVVAALEAAGAVPLAGTAVTAARGSRLQGRFALAGHRPFRATGLSVSRRDPRPSSWSRPRASRRGARARAHRRSRRCSHDAAGIAGRGGPERGRRPQRPSGRGSRSAPTASARWSGAGSAGGGTGRLRRVAFVAHVDGVDGMGDSAEMFVGRPRIPGAQSRSGADAPTWPWWCRPSRAGRRAAGARQFFLECARRLSRCEPAAWPQAAWLARSVLATGPFAAWSGRVVADGAALVGDAADFFDPVHRRGDLQRASRARSCWRRRPSRRWRARAASRPRRSAPYRRARRRAFAREVGGRAR